MFKKSGVPTLLLIGSAFGVKGQELPPAAGGRADLVVGVNGIESTEGIVACAIFPTAEGFPIEAAEGNRRTAPAR